uniref:Putative secreted protein n=1 Tax=Ixodes ricinus TaxID=34613 RepID=A0A6B0UMX1_IXORI
MKTSIGVLTPFSTLIGFLLSTYLSDCAAMVQESWYLFPILLKYLRLGEYAKSNQSRTMLLRWLLVSSPCLRCFSQNSKRTLIFIRFLRLYRAEGYSKLQLLGFRQSTKAGTFGSVSRQA